MVNLIETSSNRIVEVPEIERVVFYEQPDIAKQREIYDAVNETAKRYGGIENLTPFWTFDERDGLRGSNLKTLILANEFLAGKNERTLTVLEALMLDKAGKLTNGVYRDLGAVFYSSDGANSDVTKNIVQAVKKRDLKVPIIFHPLDLKLEEDGKTYNLNPKANLIISGEEAREVLKKFYKEEFGFRRVCRDSFGNWDADWSDLHYSYEYARVASWIRGEATREKIDCGLAAELNRQYSKQFNFLESKKAEAPRRVCEIMNRKE